MEMEYKRKIGIEDVVFFIIIFLIIGIALWLLHGSPTEVGAIIGVATFTAASELMIWRYVFKLDKNTALGFMRAKYDIEKMNLQMNNRFDIIESKLNEITNKSK
jgi:hypothetical protein